MMKNLKQYQPQHQVQSSSFFYDEDNYNPKKDHLENYLNKKYAKGVQKKHQNNHNQQNLLFNDLDDDIGNGSIDQDVALLNFKSQMNEDLNKIHKDFAGDTFSQISSTYEHQAAQNNQQQSQNDMLVKGKNISKNSHNKLYQYEEKHQYRNQRHLNDELCDSDILNNFADLQSPNDRMNMQQIINVKKQFQIPPNKHNLNNHNNNDIPNLLFNKNYNGAIPSPHSNNLNIIMNSENLQQSTSTLTIYNSGIFDEASIMRILDKTISDDDIYNGDGDHFGADNRTHQKRQKKQNEFKYDCDDVIVILSEMNQKLRDKLQKHRGISQSQVVTITNEELKQLERLNCSALEKIRHLKELGIDIFQSFDYRNVKLKQYKENLKIKIHKQIQKYKELYKKQYKHTEHYKDKFLYQEFEQDMRIKQLEDKLERQQDDINRQENVYSQMKLQKMSIMKQYDQRMNDIEHMLRGMIQSYQQDQKNQQQQKISHSFCIEEHSLLLNPKNIAKPNNKLKAKQSVEDKENESFLSNQGDQLNIKKSIKSQLLNLKKMFQEFKQVHQQYNLQQNQQEGGSMYQDSVQNLLSNFFCVQNDIQQSQIGKPESSQASVNQAFIQSRDSCSDLLENENHVIQKDVNDNNKNNTTLEMSFNQNEILLVNGKIIEDEVKNYLKLDDKITDNDLKKTNNEQIVLSDTNKLMIGSKRDKMMGRSIGSPDDLQMDEGSIGFIHSNRKQNSVEDDLFMLNNLGQEKQTLGKQHGLFDMSGIENNVDLGTSIQKEIQNQSLYSGGSDLINLNYAFNQNPPPRQGKSEYIVIKVNNREIQMPKLDINRAKFEPVEKFKQNIQNTHISSSSEESLSFITSSIQQHLQSQQHQGSFVNESISKQMILNTDTQNKLIKIGKEVNASNSINKNSLLDQNISCLDQQQLHTQENHDNCEADMSNMFGAFKDELSQLDKQTHQQQNFQQQNQNNDDTLDLDDDFEVGAASKQKLQIFKQERKKVIIPPQQVEDDKTLDLSHSIFKKSQSDPNLIFNIQDNNDDKESSSNTESQQNEQVKIKNNHTDQAKQQVNFMKLKTPQGNQIKIKFNRQSSKEQIQNIQQVVSQQEKKISNSHHLQVKGQKIRSTSGNSRAEVQNSQIIQNKALSLPNEQPQIQLKKITRGMKIKIQPKQDLTHIGKIDEENDQSKLVQQHDLKMNFTNINDTVDEIAQPITKLSKNTNNKNQLMKIAQSQKRRESAIVLDEQNLLISSQQTKNDTRNDVGMNDDEQNVSNKQLVQNYFSAAAVMQNNNNSAQPNNKQAKRSLAIRKGPLSMQNPGDFQQQQSQEGNNFIQQFKDFQDCYDIETAIKSNRKNNDDNIISPNKSQQRISQSCTPQKPNNVKQMIIPSQKILKGVQSVIPKKQLVDANSKQNNIIRRISLSKRNGQLLQQNMSIINQSIDTSYQIPQNQNASILVQSNVDSSMMIGAPYTNDQSAFIPKLQGNKIFKINPKVNNKQDIVSNSAAALSNNISYQDAQKQPKVSKVGGQPQLNINPNIILKIKKQQMRAQNEQQDQSHIIDQSVVNDSKVKSIIKKRERTVEINIDDI